MLFRSHVALAFGPAEYFSLGFFGLCLIGSFAGKEQLKGLISVLLGLMLATVGAFAVRNLVVDVIVMFVAGIVAFLMRRTGYSIAGIVLGLILGRIGEQNFAQAMQMVHYDPAVFFGRPIVSVLMVGGMLTIIANLVKAIRSPARGAGS